MSQPYSHDVAEDGERIPNEADVAAVDRVPADRNLDDRVTGLLSKHQDLDIEREAIDPRHPEQLFGHLAAKGLEAALRIAGQNTGVMPNLGAEAVVQNRANARSPRHHGSGNRTRAD